MNEPFELIVNGVKHKVDVEPETSLLEYLRNDLGLTGTKYGCGESQCGACTVLLDGIPTRSCVASLGDVGPGTVITIEGLEKDGKLHPLQEAFVEEDAMQCGYCVAGMIMSAYGLLEKNPTPTEVQIKQGLNGNVCRCCAYPNMIKAIQRAGKAMEAGK